MKKLMSLVRFLNYEANRFRQNYFAFKESHLAECVFISPSSLVQKSTLSKGVRVYENSRLIRCQVDKYSYFQYLCNVADSKFGAYCSIGPMCLIGQGEHPTDQISTHPLFFSGRDSPWEIGLERKDYSPKKQVNIGNDVWMGARVIVRDGVTIGNGAVIGAGAVVTKSVEPYAIVGGTPAKFIRSRFSQKVVKLLEESYWWEYPLEMVFFALDHNPQPLSESQVLKFLSRLKECVEEA
jgi:acetyltransferase-like isoleucine patch superfamily enzyme